jgi:hypothetical protein
MTLNLCDEWHQHDVDCMKNPQEEFFLDMAAIAYSGLAWTEKDRIEYNKVFEGL